MARKADLVLEKRKPVSQAPLPAPTVRAASKKKVIADPYFIFLAVTLAIIAFIRYSLIDVPLERDEGEYAYIGKLITDGIAPYKSAYNMKLPGTYAMYALFMSVFGATTPGIHLSLLVVNILTSLFLFFGLRKLYNAPVACFAAATYALMSLSPNFLGFAAHATHFVTLFVSIAIYFLSLFHNKPSFLFSFLVGCSFGLAFLMKQQAVFFILFGGLAILIISYSAHSKKVSAVILQALCYSAGVFVPYILAVLLLVAAGAFDKFWFWTVTYATEYTGRLTLEDGKTLFSMSFQPMWQEFRVLWLLFGIGFISIFLSSFTISQKLVAILFSVFAFLTVCPGFYFRSHYFISFLPAVALLASVSIHYISDFLSKRLKIQALRMLPLVVFGVIFTSVVTEGRTYYLEGDPIQVSKVQYGANPFIESIEIADYIKRNSAPEDKIGIMGSEPQIFLYADRQSATGYIYTYALVEHQPYNLQMQQEMAREIEQAKPKFLVSCVVNFSWLRNGGVPSYIFDWFVKYVQERYTIAGIVDMVAPGAAVYKWDNDALTYSPTAENFILIFKRKDMPAAVN